MGDQLEPVLAAMAGGTSEPLGWFEYDVPSGTWTWSASLFQMHGFEPGEIVPTTEIFEAHKHPQDRQHTDEVLAAVLQTGQPFCCRHRIITNQQQVRTVVTIGRGELDPDGRVRRVFGYFVDITDAGRRASEADIHDAVEKSAATRAVIEQAKGALMVVQGVSAEDAFAVLRWHSSHANLKLRHRHFHHPGHVRPVDSGRDPEPTDQPAARSSGSPVRRSTADEPTVNRILKPKRSVRRGGRSVLFGRVEGIGGGEAFETVP